MTARDTQTFEISTDKARLELGMIHRFLSRQSDWARGIPERLVRVAIANSLCFGVYGPGGQVGFARVISDYATFANLVDVFILPDWRGRGLASRLLAAVVAHEALRGLRRFTLATSDAHALYARFGFRPLRRAESFMEIYHPDVYSA